MKHASAKQRAEAAAAELLQEEQAAADLAESAKQRALAKREKKARQKLRKQVTLTKRLVVFQHKNLLNMMRLTHNLLQGQQPTAQQEQGASNSAERDAAGVQHGNGDDHSEQSQPQASQSAALPRLEPPAAVRPATPVPRHTSRDAQPEESATVTAPRPVALSPAGLMASFGMLTIGRGPGSAVMSNASVPTQPTKGSNNLAPPHLNVAPDAASLDPQESNEDCIVCWFAAPSVVFQPCGHLCCCNDCAGPMIKGSFACPMCRGTIRSGIVLL